MSDGVQLCQLGTAAAEIGACPDGWIGYRFEVKDARYGYVPTRFFVTGCVPDGVYSRGPSKGRPRFKRPLPNTTRIVTFTQAEFDAWEKGWEARTGQCAACGGKATELARWSREKGAEMRPCRKCEGTGKSTQAREGGS